MALEAAGAVALTGDAELVQLIRAGNQMLEALMTAQDIPAGVLLAVGGVDRQPLTPPSRRRRNSWRSPWIIVRINLCSAERKPPSPRPRPGFSSRGAFAKPCRLQRAYHTERFEPVLSPLRDFFQQATVTSAGDSLVFLHDGRAFSRRSRRPSAPMRCSSGPGPCVSGKRLKRSMRKVFGSLWKWVRAVIWSVSSTIF